MLFVGFKRDFFGLFVGLQVYFIAFVWIISCLGLGCLIASFEFYISVVLGVCFVCDFVLLCFVLFVVWYGYDSFLVNGKLLCLTLFYVLYY